MGYLFRDIISARKIKKPSKYFIWDMLILFMKFLIQIMICIPEQVCLINGKRF